MLTTGVCRTKNVERAVLAGVKECHFQTLSQVGTYLSTVEKSIINRYV